LVSFDRALTRNITLGLRAGFAFSGGPPAGKNDTSAGTAFLPLHAEARLSYWFGQSPLGRKGFRPYVHIGGGVAQVDAKVKEPINDCTSGNLPKDDGSQTAPRYLCSTGQAGNYNPADPAQVPPMTLDAWKKLGQAFVTGGGGVVYAFKENMGVQLNLNAMFMLPSSGLVLEPSLGIDYGF
jgi:hypothetical protein